MGFRRDATAISGLSVLLVMASAGSVGALLAWLLGIDLWWGIALGAVVAPTDAVATSIVKGLGASPRVVSMLEGEGLLNDATALVLLRTAVGGAAASVSLGGAVGGFALAWGSPSSSVWPSGTSSSRCAGACTTRCQHAAVLRGAVRGVAAGGARGGSGLVAAVVAGLVATGTHHGSSHRRRDCRTPDLAVGIAPAGGRRLPAHGPGAARHRGRGGLPGRRGGRGRLRRRAGRGSGGGRCGTVRRRPRPRRLRRPAAPGLPPRRQRGAAVRERVTALQERFDGREPAEIAAAITARRAQASAARRVQRGLRGGGLLGAVAAARRRPVTEDAVERLRTRLVRGVADIDYLLASPLGWREGAVVVWAGMRGAVTVAAAQTLPEDAPQRELLVLVAYLVAVASLLLQGLTLRRVVLAVGSTPSPAPQDPLAERAALLQLADDAAASAEVSTGASGTAEQDSAAGAARRAARRPRRGGLRRRGADPRPGGGGRRGDQPRPQRLTRAARRGGRWDEFTRRNPEDPCSPLASRDLPRDRSFIGTAATRLPEPRGLAAAWWWPKPQVGNTHPGATSPLGMVSACAFSGAYPTGYGQYSKSLEGVPVEMFDHLQASGFTHFQQSGTGAIRKYYNYARVTPMLQPLDDLGQSWSLHDEQAEAGYYAATLGSGVRCELTVGPKTAVHRYTFPEHRSARVVVDLSCGGLAIEHGRTVPLRAYVENLGQGRAQGTVVVEGVPLSLYLEVDTAVGASHSAQAWRQMLWHDRRLIEGGTRLDFDRIRQTTLRPFGLLFMGPARAGQVVEVRIGFSLRGVEQARQNLEAEYLDRSRPAPGEGVFDVVRQRTGASWADHVGRVAVEGGTPARRQVMATAAYHSLIKPCIADDESPFWPSSGPYAFDISTMWDIYKTQIPLLAAIAPARAADLLESLIRVSEEEGNFPIGYRMARGTDRFFRQASALAHTALADAHATDLAPIDWSWALVHMDDDLRRGYGEMFIDSGVVHPISHTLDLAFANHCTAQVARSVGDAKLAADLAERSLRWVNAFDVSTGLLRDSEYYEGGKWNYSFRLLHDMAGRIALAGGDDRFVEMLDAFFGFGAPRVRQPGQRPNAAEMLAGYALNRFEGLNNEPDMEAPWAYHWAGRPDRTAEVVHAALTHQFGTGRGGLPGNDDSGGLSSWYVWASLGLFPVAGLDLFLLSAPAFERTVLAVPGGELVVEARGHREQPISADGAFDHDAPPGAGSRPQHLLSATLDGVSLPAPHLTMARIHRGGRLELELGEEPNGFGRDHRPPSPAARPR